MPRVEHDFACRSPLLHMKPSLSLYRRQRSSSFSNKPNKPLLSMKITYMEWNRKRKEIYFFYSVLVYYLLSLVISLTTSFILSILVHIYIYIDLVVDTQHWLSPLLDWAEVFDSLTSRLLAIKSFCHNLYCH